jgi:hypothetical protein
VTTKTMRPRKISDQLAPDRTLVGGAGADRPAAPRAPDIGANGEVSGASPGSSQWWEDRGIIPEVRGLRYQRYLAKDKQPLGDAYDGLSPAQRGTMTRRAHSTDEDGNPVDGLIIFRHAPQGMSLGRIYPELRPDRPVKTRRIEHFHGSTKPEGELLNSKGNPVAKKHIRTAKSMRKHIVKDHCGKNVEGVHEYQKYAKYLFPPSPRVSRTFYHEHDEMRPDRRDAHVAGRYHQGKDQAGRHSHTRMVKDEHESLARRIDVHPLLSREKFENADRVFFALEGCIKSDAIFSAGEVVFSVPSVTLWQAEELRDFLESYSLIGKTVIIVPDSDWADNPAVFTQAMLCRSMLRTFGVNALVAAPPADADGKKQGVDDFLGKGKGKLDDLLIIDRQPPVGLEQWLLRHKPNHNMQGIKRDAEVLDALARHAGSNGKIQPPLLTLTRILGMDNVRQAQRAIESLLKTGAIKTDGSLETVRGQWKGNFYSYDEDWEERPTITIHRELRAHELPQMSLGNLLPHRAASARKRWIDTCVEALKTELQRPEIRDHLRRLYPGRTDGVSLSKAERGIKRQQKDLRNEHIALLVAQGKSDRRVSEELTALSWQPGREYLAISPSAVFKLRKRNAFVAIGGGMTMQDTQALRRIEDKLDVLSALTIQRLLREHEEATGKDIPALPLPAIQLDKAA